MTIATSRQVTLSGLTFDIAAISEQGPRDENQDALSLEEFQQSGFVAVADGMGGERGGRMAADTALRAIMAAAPIQNLDDARRAVRAADASVTNEATKRPDEHGGMGCALGFLALTAGSDAGPEWIAAHVGDVRILSRSPDGALRLETRDHTPAFARWEAGEITLDQIPDTPGANRLQRAIGRGGQPDVTWMPARPGWSWLIISDGVYKALRLDELAELMADRSAEAACEAIRLRVQERGPDDNFTALLVRAEGGPPASPSTTDPLPAMNRTSAPDRSSRSAWAVVALLLSLVALGAAGFALLTVQRTRDDAALSTELVRMQAALDSLEARVTALDQPFGPAAPSPLDSAAAALPGDTNLP
ncbi:MAG TPA: protein phosphatase 2C domain-containing protein [Longimicrobiaceae bacterium]|nr:protein phosphatase 2C domain-containing protein [Longimicrobiaceae bacterium]